MAVFPTSGADDSRRNTRRPDVTGSYATPKSGRPVESAAMSEPLLPAVVVDTGPNPDASVIWLHGLGDTGHGWSAAAPELALPKSLAVRFLFPHAPTMPVTINQGFVMPAWYDLRAADVNARADVAGVRASRERIDALIAAERARGVKANRIVLAGFSQGGVIAIYAGLRHPERLGGVVGLSTYVVDPDSLPREASAANRDVPVFMAHGTEDPVIRFAWAEASRRVLEANGWKVEWHAYRMEHSANQDELRKVGAFITRVLGP